MDKQADADAASVVESPCPFCAHLERCPHAMRPKAACQYLWPLAQPARRIVAASHPLEAEVVGMATADLDYSQLLRKWEHGEHLTDADYLLLRRHILTHPNGEEPVGRWLLHQVTFTRTERLLSDFLRYYRLTDHATECVRPFEKATRCALVTTTPEMVQADQSPVPHKFERLFFDTITQAFWGLAVRKFLQMPEDDAEFRKAFEDVWRATLVCGNGWYGFTVVPLVHVGHMVRYQLLGKKVNRAISWSVANYVLWRAQVFPGVAQLAVSGLSDNIVEECSVGMFEPLVQSCSALALHNLQISGEERRTMREDLAGRLREELRKVLDDYHFMYAKSEQKLGPYGNVGFSSSKDAHEAFDNRQAQLGTGINHTAVAHVGVTHFVRCRLRDFIRAHFPKDAGAPRREVSLHAPMGEDGELMDLLEDTGSRVGRS